MLSKNHLPVNEAMLFKKKLQVSVLMYIAWAYPIICQYGQAILCVKKHMQPVFSACLQGQTIKRLQDISNRYYKEGKKENTQWSNKYHSNLHG